MRIAFDLDGVLYNFEQCSREWFQKTYPAAAHAFEVPATQWKFFLDWGLTADQFNEQMTYATDEGFLYLSQGIDPAWIEVLKFLRVEGHTIHLVTSRVWGVRSEANTVEWLIREDVPYDTLTFATDKSIIDAEVLVEDRPENLDRWFEHDPMRWGVIVDQLYNTDYCGDAMRAFSPWDVARHIEVIAEAQSIETPVLVESALQEAQRLVHGDRQAAYGHPIDDFTRTGRMWGAILGIPDVDPAKVGLCMAAVKISRECNAPKRDNRVDLAGYAETVDMVRERQETVA